MKNNLVLIASVVLGAFLFSQVALASPNDDARARSEERRQAQQERSLDRRERIDAMKAEIRSRVEAKKASINQQQCERLQNKIESKVPKLANSATVQQRVLDTMYSRVTEFYESGQLTTPNFEELDSAVSAEKTETADAISALFNGEMVVDCDNPSTAKQLSTYRVSLTLVKQQIKEYRKALIDMISSMRSAATEEAQQDDDPEDTENNQEVETSELQEPVDTESDNESSEDNQSTNSETNEELENV